MIEKPSIIITSIGRTGTEFFARIFADLIPGCTSLHEPDIFQNTGVENSLGHYFGQVRRAGIWRMFFLKALGKWTLVQLSDSRFLAKIDTPRTARDLMKQRQAFIRNMPGDVYVEANIGYYALLDVTPDVFGEHRAIYIVRDGRDWVRSHMNWGEFYGKGWMRSLISHNWPSATDLQSDVYAERWPAFSRFERLCWAWSRLNDYGVVSLSKNLDARLFRFEEIFNREGNYHVLDDLVSFATSQPGIASTRVGTTKGWLDRKIHRGSEGFPAWKDWTKDQKGQFKQICGPFMEKMGYSL